MNKTFAAVLAFIAIAAFAALVAIIGIGCAAFDGPATSADSTYYYDCGDQRCRIGREECSKTSPKRCIWLPESGASRDAGADR